ncbi:MAG TPA: peptide chain release factor N(5)-glutamine methyltransferase [Terriglobales bacterium]|nr:peptide chain release factor N(5)-glutamine methyltransferase [Terriglobales bacterium]
MRLGDSLQSAIRFLTDEQVPSPRMNAEVLLMFVLGVDRAYLYAHPERELTADERARYDEALRERATGKPAQYITGHQEFWGMDLIVTPAVLIPRPETEHVVETVLALAREFPARTIVDVGTGSGCIALALAKELPQAEITATDISPEALDVAKANAARHQLEKRIRFVEADLLPKGDALTGVSTGVDLVVSNPPYVSEEERDKVQREVRKFEPRVALFGGEHGFDIYRRLIPQAKAALRSGGWLVMEMGFSQEEEMRRMLSGWSEVRVAADLQGIPRVIAARK